MTIAILCDFDDTVTQGNVAHLILERFGNASWQEVRRRYLAGEIPPTDYFERPFNAMTATRLEMKTYVQQKGRIHDTFSKLANYCSSKDIEIAIVTLGLDFYVEAMLEHYRLDWIPVYSVGTRFTNNGIEFEFPYASEECGRWGICKCSIVKLYQTRGYQVLYIGDGVNDMCPAQISDVVFAQDQLLSLCQAAGVPHHEFRDFEDVVNDVQDLVSRQKGGEG